MKTAEEILSMVNEFLANLPYERKPMSLYEPIRYVLSMGGKRIRPTLMLLGYNLFKDNPEKILMNAVALETYHNYTLLHDYLDVYGDTKVFGKEIGGDITSNKKTYMLINAFNHANDAQRAELQKWVDAEEFDRKEKVAAVTRLYNEIGIDKLAQDKIAYYFEQSKKYLDAVSVPAERKEELAKYAQKMMKRQY